MRSPLERCLGVEGTTEMGEFSNVLRTNQEQPVENLKECPQCRGEASFKSRSDGGTPQMHYVNIVANCTHDEVEKASVEPSDTED